VVYCQLAPKIQTSHAILLVSGNYVLQLRDNKPTITAAGQWSLFGGRLKPDETPLQAINREISEELSFRPKRFRYLWFRDYYEGHKKDKVRIWFFTADVSGPWPKHRLREGKAVGIFPFAQIKSLKMAVVIKEAIERFDASFKVR
jgi:8-oxo-dGTP pyrophosphatase MutT (NUDIX family)